MIWPTSQDYNEAIQNAATNMSDPDLMAGQPTLNAIGLPVPRSGNFADVYQFRGGDGTMWAVKCFTRRVEGLQERYLKINQYLEKAELPFTVGFKYLEEGVRIRGKWYPLLKMEWVEGFTLNEFVRNNADKSNYLDGLMQMWAKLTGKLRDANMAHADLQHGNVLLVPGNANSKLGLKLIDYDGMWVPPLADNHSGEVGHPNFQHPLRLKDQLYNADVDRFPHLVIGCALRATVVGGKELWQKFDNGDNLLFREQDLRDPSSAPVFKALWQLEDSVVRKLVGHIALSSQQPLRKTPWLDDLLLENGEQLRAEEKKRVEELLGIASAKVSVPKENAVPEEASDLNVVEEEEDEREAQPRRAKAKRKKRRSAKKSPLPMLIVSVVLAALLAAGFIAVYSGGKKNKSPEVTQNSKTVVDEKTLGIAPKNNPNAVSVPSRETISPAYHDDGQSLTLDLGDNISMKLVRIKAGKFLMGSSPDDSDAKENEQPQHEVTISRDFYMGVCPVRRCA